MAKRRHKSFELENDAYEFYYGGTESGAKQVQEELEHDYHLKGELLFSTVFGWMVRVRKQ